MKWALAIVYFSIAARAEYRVFTLYITNKEETTTKQIETTLDPDQFTTLYPLNLNEKILYVETWRCKGRTDSFKAHCPKPDATKD